MQYPSSDEPNHPAVPDRENELGNESGAGTVTRPLAAVSLLHGSRKCPGCRIPIPRAWGGGCYLVLEKAALSP